AWSNRGDPSGLRPPYDLIGLPWVLPLPDVRCPPLNKDPGLLFELLAVEKYPSNRDWLGHKERHPLPERGDESPVA
ncbi:MAG: hypothetical protein RL533_721, partial [Pseudomonadota bacterium]